MRDEGHEVSHNALDKLRGLHKKKESNIYDLDLSSSDSEEDPDTKKQVGKLVRDDKDWNRENTGYIDKSNHKKK